MPNLTNFIAMFKRPLAICEIDPWFQRHPLLLIKYYDIKYHYFSSQYINSCGNEFWAKIVRAPQHETTHSFTEFKGVVVVHPPFCASHPFLTFLVGAVPFFVSVQRTEAVQSWSRNSKEAFACIVLFPSCVSTSTHRALCPSFQLITFQFYFFMKSLFS